ncbi:MAG: hypothetical protein IPG60_10025 [Bacteroidetes bacterium]|nr:hypothetical protein [Bacteroidota bacterium]
MQIDIASISCLMTIWSLCCILVFFNAGNLREVTTGIQAFGLNKLNHLGLNYFPRRSTLSDANRRRPAQFFADLYHSLYNMYFVLPDSRIKLNREEDILLLIPPRLVCLLQ